MSEIHLSSAAWRKSTRSSGDGACVEVATLQRGTAVRDSKNPTGTALTVTPAGWVAFTAAIRSGEFD